MVGKMAKGKIKNPQWIKCKCQYCGKEFNYYRDSSTYRKACYECIPEGANQDASLLRRLIKKKAVHCKGNKCECCGNTYPYMVYDFHHINPSEKDFSLGDKVSTVKWDLVQKEIDKCILVCANCHRMIHSGDIQLEQQEMVASN
jgi:NAD-dependent dihydropyrimidine dehydrogenase PreA subunit